MKYSRRGTHLEHVFSHSAIHAVLKAFIFKVELNIVLTWLLTNCDIKENLNRSLWNGPKFIWLTELDIVPSQLTNVMLPQFNQLPRSAPTQYLLQNMADFLTEENLIDVDFGPGVDNGLHDCFSLCFLHFFETTFEILK